MSFRNGQLLFTDGRIGGVFQDQQGQFVLGDDGRRVDGIRILDGVDKVHE